MSIHPSAIVSTKAIVDSSAQIGPFSVIEPGVQIGPGCVVGPHVVLRTGTRIGRESTIDAHCTLGGPPQDLKHDGAPSYLEIGERCVIRESVTIHRATKPEGVTRIGNECFLMGFSHIGHECVLEDGVIVTQGAMLSGHVQVGRRANIGGMAGITQFVRIGAFSMVGAKTSQLHDLPPFMLMAREEGVIGPNTIGMRRAGFSPAERAEVRAMYKALYRTDQPIRIAIPQVIEMATTPAGRILAEFLKQPTRRGYARLARRQAEPADGVIELSS